MSLVLFRCVFSHTPVVTSIPMKENRSLEGTKRITANHSSYYACCIHILTWQCHLESVTRVLVIQKLYSVYFNLPEMKTQCCQAHIPFGWGGGSRVHVGHHGVVHVSQRPRRAKIEILIPVSALKNQKGNKRDAGEKDMALCCDSTRPRAAAAIAWHKGTGRASSAPA